MPAGNADGTATWDFRLTWLVAEERMIKRGVVYPYLFLLYVILYLLSLNLDQIDPFQAVRPLIALCLITLLGMLLLYAFFKDWQYAGYVVFLVLVFFFVFGHINRLTQARLPADPTSYQLVIILLWGLLLVILGLRPVWTRLGCAGWAVQLLTVSLTIAILIQASLGLGKLLRTNGNAPQQSDQVIAAPVADPVSLDCTKRPDIYYIVLDGYGRADVLEEMYGVDNSSFLTTLEQKGFYIANRSSTNYTQTIYSIPSALSFSYLNPEPKSVSGSKYFLKLMVENRIMHMLKQCSYKTVALESGFFFTNHLEADVFLSGGTELNEFESLLLSGTPLDVLTEALDLKVHENTYRGHRDRILNSFEHLIQIPKMDSPKFVFVHILTPHPPFVFDSQGRPIEPGGSYSLGDGENFFGSWEQYQQGYAGQVQFVNQRIEKTIDAILAKSATPPIIILQGDHGSGGFLDWRSPDRSCLWERSAILNAYFLPDDGKEKLYPNISPVNSFRVILNAYFGTNLELLPDKTYFTSHRLPRQIIDITGQRDSMQNCILP